MNIIQKIKYALGRLTNRYRFSDGTYIAPAHKYALRVDMGGESFLIGFERALEPGIDRLIHEDNIFRQIRSGGEEKELDLIVRAEIVAKTKSYCSVKGIAYRVVD